MVRLDAANLTPVIEALEHGRDGFPRWIAAAVGRRFLAQTLESIAGAAASRGFVALPVDAYLRARIIDVNQFDERTLLLLDTQSDPSRAHAALLGACAQSSRPHLLLTLRAGAEACHSMFVREARAAYTAGRVERESPQVTEILTRARRATEFVACGRHAAAERLLRDAGAALARRGADRHASRIVVTLARLLIERGHMKDALRVLDEAVRYAQTAQSADLAIEARLWQATARVGDAAFVEAEGICRAALEAPHLQSSLKAWANAILADALLWQGRAEEAPDVGLDEAETLEPAVIAGVHDVRVRWLLARGQPFEAGRCVERLRAIATETGNPAVETIARQADLTLLATIGDLSRLHDAFVAAIAAARVAREPLRAAWARLIWIDAVRRAGLSDAATTHLQRLKRLARVAPPLLQREIARRVSAQTASLSPAPAVSARARRGSLPTVLLRMALEDDDDRSAIKRLAERISSELETSRIDVLSDAAGPVTALCTVGEGLPTRLGTRVFEAGFGIGPERQAGGWEMGLPVRFASRTIAAIVCRWPIDRVVPADAAELLELTGAIAAPRLDALCGASREETKAATAVPELLGVSDAMANVRRAIVRAAAAPFNVLIEGESGVGKELAARAVHQFSARRERRFCDLNCAALPEELLESELFGHARGAFSGAVVERAGLFEEADGGTLLLDEVADLSARAQAKLLRAIQQQEIRRVGESFSRKIDVRIVAAANRDMRAEAAAGRFRQDLLYRLDVVRIDIPPLRARPADIPVLAEHCWSLATARTGSKARLSPTTLNELARYHWPGNVRELQNVIASLAVAAPSRGWVRPAALPSIIWTATTVSSGRLTDAREQFERRFVEVALARAGGNRARAARSLGLSRQGLLKILARLRIDCASAVDESC